MPSDEKCSILSRICFICFICLSVAVSFGCSHVEPLQLKDSSVNIIWPPPPNTPRIQYLREIKGPEDIYPPKTKFQKISEMITGENREFAELITPYCVTTSNKDVIYIADTTGGIVHKYDLVSREVEFIIKAGNDGLESPVGLAADSDDNLYVSDSVLAKVYKFNKRGELIRELLPPSGFERPAGIALNKNGEKYIVDVTANKLHKFNKNDDYLGEFPKSRPGEELNTPSHVALDSSGNVYVTDAMNFQIKIFNPNGDLINKIGEVGDQPGAFARPKGLALDSDGNIYVVDATHDNFQIFNQAGKLLLFVGKNGTGPGEFYLPGGIHIDAKDRIFIADMFNRRIQVFQLLKTGGN